MVFTFGAKRMDTHGRDMAKARRARSARLGRWRDDQMRCGNVVSLGDTRFTLYDVRTQREWKLTAIAAKRSLQMRRQARQEPPAGPTTVKAGAQPLPLRRNGGL